MLRVYILFNINSIEINKFYFQIKYVFFRQMHLFDNIHVIEGVKENKFQCGKLHYISITEYKLTLLVNEYFSV